MTGTLNVLRQRRAESSRLRSRTDDAHVALVIEGGGMRGAYASGMLLGLQKLGLTSAFDSVHGSSVGAHLGVYFATGQAEVGREIFTNEALDRRFIAPERALICGPIMDVDWMVDEVFAHKRRMRLEALADSPEMHIVCTNALNGETVEFSYRGDDGEFFVALRATAKIPFIAGPAVRHNGLTLTDGGIAQQIALQSALAAGATHVLVLTTGRRSRLRRKKTSLAHRFERWSIELLYGSRLASAYDARRDTTNRTLDVLCEASPRLGGAELLGCFVPDDAPAIARLTRSRIALTEAAATCESAIVELIG